MGIVTQNQVVISCDSCLNTFIESGLYRVTVVEMARADGWLIGGKVTCPNCQKAGQSLKPVKEGEIR